MNLCMYATEEAFKRLKASTQYTPSFLWRATLANKNVNKCMFDINAHGNVLFRAIGEKLTDEKTVIIRIADILIDDRDAVFKNRNDLVYLNHGKTDWKTL